METPTGKILKYIIRNNSLGLYYNGQAEGAAHAVYGPRYRAKHFMSAEDAFDYASENLFTSPTLFEVEQLSPTPPYVIPTLETIAAGLGLDKSPAYAAGYELGRRDYAGPMPANPYCRATSIDDYLDWNLGFGEGWRETYDALRRIKNADTDGKIIEAYESLLVGRVGAVVISDLLSWLNKNTAAKQTFHILSVLVNHSSNTTKNAIEETTAK